MTQALIEEGLFRAYDLIPPMPMRLNAVGTAPKNGGKYRRTCDGSAPLGEVSDKADVPATPVNVLIGLKDKADAPFEGEEDAGWGHQEDLLKWAAQEVKPRVADCMYDGALLRVAGLFALHEDLLTASTTSPVTSTRSPSRPRSIGLRARLCRAGAGGSPPSPQFVMEERLNFGLAHGSNIGQRLAQLVVLEFDRFMEAVEVPI